MDAVNRRNWESDGEAALDHSGTDGGINTAGRDQIELEKRAHHNTVGRPVQREESGWLEARNNRRSLPPPAALKAASCLR